MMWLPYYIVKGLGKSSTQSVTLASEFDAGSVVGGIVAGHLCDKLGYRALIMCPMLLIAIPIFLSFRFITADGFPAYYVLVFFIGFLIGGTANLLSSLVCTDLGRRKDL
jgi:OPA family glycerol-3-phosphate transporter-like MFS transporter 3